MRLITLLRDGADACRPLNWPKPDGADAIAAQLALRTFVAAACELKTPAAPLASAIAADDPLDGRGEGGERRQGARRAGDPGRHATAATGLEQDGVLTGTGADAVRALARVVPAERLLLAAQGADDACRPLAWQHTNGVEELAAELVLYGVAGAACESGLSVLAVAEALTGGRAAGGARGAAAAGDAGGRRRGREGGRHRHASARSR